MAFEDRCYVVYGTGFKPLKIKGLDNKNDLLASLKKKGFSPKSVQLNCNSNNGKKCKTTATAY